MLPSEYTSLETAARTVRDRMAKPRATRFEAPTWPRSRGPQPNPRRR
jgi:hypothetical protein